jgi:hypothetical protein
VEILNFAGKRGSEYGAARETVKHHVLLIYPGKLPHGRDPIQYYPADRFSVIFISRDLGQTVPGQRNG